MILKMEKPRCSVGQALVQTMLNAEIQLQGPRELHLNLSSPFHLLCNFGQSKFPELPAPQVLHLQSGETCTSGTRGAGGDELG